MVEPRGRELVARYKANYDIDGDSYIDEELILAHWTLEKRLRKELLDSTPENRWETFEEAYTTLYRELSWRNKLARNDRRHSPAAQYAHWAQLIGSAPKKVYEVGSGQGELIEYLAKCGFDCKATEITKERGSKWTSPHPNLKWGTSDGIHFGQFEPAGYYDAVLSNQVIEHIHPDDILEHFRGVFTILCNGGRYIFSTPHSVAGPSDVSGIFRQDTPVGMHLKEYTYGELVGLLKQAGFRRISTALRPPSTIRALLGERFNIKSSRLYLSYLQLLEKLIAVVPRQTIRRTVARLLKPLLFTSNILLIAETTARRSSSATVNPLRVLQRSLLIAV